MEVVIRAFKPAQDPETCLKFIEGHRRLLEIHFGISKITSSNTEWLDHENTYVIVAEDKERTKVYGGARVQLPDGKIPLPIETAIGKYDPNIHTMVVPGTCEICGLWNSMEVAGLGIGSMFMARVGIVVALQLHIKKIFFLCAPVTVRMGKRVGGVIETDLGNKGTFFYPKDDFVATAMVIKTDEMFTLADAKEKERIIDIYKNPIQQVVEIGPKGELFVDYQLKIADN